MGDWQNLAAIRFCCDLNRVPDIRKEQPPSRVWARR
jgi:hypothetical protein